MNINNWLNLHYGTTSANLGEDATGWGYQRQPCRCGTCIRPGFLEALCINLRASVTGFRQVIDHLLRCHVTGSLALKSCFSFRGPHFTLLRASPLAFHWLLIALALRRRILARRDRSGVTTDMSDDALSLCFFDQCLMHPPCEVALGKFSKGPRKSGFTRYFAGEDPAAQVPQPGSTSRCSIGALVVRMSHTAFAKNARAVMTKSYRHLTFEERCQVKNPKKSGLSKGSIAQHPTLTSVRTTPSLG